MVLDCFGIMVVCSIVVGGVYGDDWFVDYIVIWCYWARCSNCNVVLVMLFNFVRSWTNAVLVLDMYMGVRSILMDRSDGYYSFVDGIIVL